MTLIERDRMIVREGPFCVLTIVQGFAEVSYGNESPDVLRCSAGMAERLRKLFVESTEVIPAWNLSGSGPDMLLDMVKVSDWMPDDEIRLENSARPKGTDYYNRFNAKVKFTQ